MAKEFVSEISPAQFVGNFQGYIQAVQKELEGIYGKDAGQFESVSERAELEAPIVASRTWLVERWGEQFPCPVCENVEWTLTEVSPTIRPRGFLAFSVVCGYCGNTMDVVPGYAPMDAPRRYEQLHFPAPDQ
jgi:hypothetical protein